MYMIIFPDCRQKERRKIYRLTDGSAATTENGSLVSLAEMLHTKAYHNREWFPVEVGGDIDKARPQKGSCQAFYLLNRSCSKQTSQAVARWGLGFDPHLTRPVQDCLASHLPIESRRDCGVCEPSLPEDRQAAWFPRPGLDCLTLSGKNGFCVSGWAEGGSFPGLQAEQLTRWAMGLRDSAGQFLTLTFPLEIPTSGLEALDHALTPHKNQHLINSRGNTVTINAVTLTVVDNKPWNSHKMFYLYLGTHNSGKRYSTMKLPKAITRFRNNSRDSTAP
ncbi:hypothetical protein RRG08_066519 [Elysia crispata]|uniref:Uncharacterized protein n=1 Tax=Elysia crispata TaxID=231223 RepID=A0AAE0ZM62_9GAST|nr:hypothetical protein RRG08_066519 [Elysia crispata]